MGCLKQIWMNEWMDHRRIQEIATWLPLLWSLVWRALFTSLHTCQAAEERIEWTTEDHVHFGIQVLLFTSLQCHSIDLLHITQSTSYTSFPFMLMEMRILLLLLQVERPPTIWSTHWGVITIIKHLWVTSKKDRPRIRRRSAVRFQQWANPLYGGTTPPSTLPLDVLHYRSSSMAIINLARFEVLSDLWSFRRILNY